MSSQTTKQHSCPAETMGRKQLGFFPLVVLCQRFLSLCSGFASSFLLWWDGLKSLGWSEKLLWQSKTLLVWPWQAFMASPEQSCDVTSAVTLHVFPIAPCVPTAGAVYGECQGRPSLWPRSHLKSLISFFQWISIIYKCKEVLFLWSWGKKKGTARILPELPYF